MCRGIPTTLTGKRIQAGLRRQSVLRINDADFCIGKSMPNLSILRYRCRIEWPADSKRHDSNCWCPRHVYSQEINLSVHPAEPKYTVVFGETLPTRPSRPTRHRKSHHQNTFQRFTNGSQCSRIQTKLHDRADHIPGRLLYRCKEELRLICPGSREGQIV